MNKVISVFLYLFVFCVSLFCVRLAEQIYNKSVISVQTIAHHSNKRLWLYRVLCLSIAVLLPCALAALRSDSVGVDTHSITELVEQFSGYSSFSQVVIGSGFTQYEFLFAVVIYLSSRVSSQPYIALFILQFFTITPILLSAIILRNKLSLTISMSAYLFLYFNESLNAMRQSIACSFIVLGTAILINHLENKEFSKRSMMHVVLCYVCAVLFHKTGFLGVIAIIVLLIITRCKNSKIITLVSYGLIISVPLFLSIIRDILMRFGLMNQSFSYYFDIFVTKQIDKGYIVNPFSLYCSVFMFLKICLVAVPVLFIKKSSIGYDFSLFKRIVVCGLLLFASVLYSVHTTYGQRLSLYFDYFLIVFISCVFHNAKLKKGTKVFIVFSLLIGYWMLWVVLFGWSGSEIYDFRFI